jgi:photosystem II stability/assembly factor-like uncharacterized protein/DNA-binding beta-propeller fold protein YncE
MRKSLFAILLAGLLALAAAGLVSIPQARALALGAAPLPSPYAAVPLALTPLPPESGIPALVDKLYFGVPAGNGVQPQRVAIDSQRRRVYTLNYGLSARKEGNTLSVVDLQTGRVTALLRLGNMDQDASFSPTPLDLQADPYRPRLYALWGDRYSSPSAVHLIVIDTEALTVTATLTGVEAVAPGPDRLYLAGDTRLWAVDPVSLAEVAGRDLEARTYNVPLLLDVEAKRLYLGRGKPWSVEAFAADTLQPAGSYAVAGEELAQAALDPANRRVLIVEKEGEQASLRALDADGRPSVRPAPVVLPKSYADFPLVVAGKTLYVAGGQFPAYRLFAYSLSDLTPQGSLPLPTMPENLTADVATGLLYATHNGGGSSILALDPAGGPFKTIYTGLTIQSALADPAGGRLYVLDDGGTLRVLGLADYTEIARVETGFTSLNGYYSGYGELSLDAGRHRLAIGGDPLRIVDTASFQVTAYPGLRGQVSLDPASERVYLTPPCQCRMEQCNTLVLNARTMTGTLALFPAADPFIAPCAVATRLDSANQLLYADINNGTPGSNGGNYFSVFDVSGPPQKLYEAFEISYGRPAIDSARRRAFFPRYRFGGRSFIHRFEAQGKTVTETMAIVGAAGQLAYDPGYDRLYAATGDGLLVFDGGLALLAETTLPDDSNLLTFDPQGQRLYLKDEAGSMLEVATGGGQLAPPPPAVSTTETPQQQKLLAAPDGTLFRIYGFRLYRSADGGQSWQLLGQGLPGRGLSEVAVSPNYKQDRTLLAGLAGYGVSGGLYRSTDGGDTWRPTTRGLTDLDISLIVFSPSFAVDRTIFLTAQDKGLFRSTDGGDSWTGLAGGYASGLFHMSIGGLALSPTYGDDHLLIINYNNLLRSTDGGDSWTDSGVPGGLVAFSPDFAHDRLVLSEGRWRSADGGQTWQPSAVGLEPTEWGAANLFFSPQFAADQTVYILLKQGYDGPLTLQRSVDAGRSWQSVLSGLPVGFELSAAAALPNGDLSLSGRGERQVSIQPGSLAWGSRRAAVDLAKIDLQDLAVAPEGTLFAGNAAAGIFKSADGGRTWTEMAFPAREPVLGAARLALADNGTLFAAIGTVVERSDDGGQTWTHLPGLPMGFEITTLAVSPRFSQDGVVLLGGNYSNNRIVRSADGGRTWRAVFDGDSVEGASDVVGLAFSFDFARDRTVYAWLQDAGLLRSTDAGLTWSLVTRDKEHYVQVLLAAPFPAGQLILGALEGRVLISRDGGQTWRDVGGNVPDARMWSSALALGLQDTLYLGTDVGVYRTEDGGQTWAPASAGLLVRPGETKPPAVRALRYAGGHLYAALQQGGLYVSDDGGRTWRSTLASQTAAPTPTVPPAPKALSPTPTPAAPSCPTPPERFADLWASRVARLGCPLGAAASPTMVEQTFEGGVMFWRSDTAAIYALPAGAPYARYDDTWNDSQPAYSCPASAPSQTPPTPQRGFGKVWCTQPAVRQALGNATVAERGFAAQVQDFDAGLIFKTDQGITYILESRSNTWEQVK